MHFLWISLLISANLCSLFTKLIFLVVLRRVFVASANCCLMSVNLCWSLIFILSYFTLAEQNRVQSFNIAQKKITKRNRYCEKKAEFNRKTKDTFSTSAWPLQSSRREGLSTYRILSNILRIILNENPKGVYFPISLSFYHLPISSASSYKTIIVNITRNKRVAMRRWKTYTQIERRKNKKKNSNNWVQQQKQSFIPRITYPRV